MSSTYAREDGRKVSVQGSKLKKAVLSGGCKMTSKKSLRIEYLYLDLATCDRCIGTDEVLEEVLKVLQPTLELAGYEVGYQKIEIDSAQQAEAYQFLSSPTIRINGLDIMGEILETSCGCCSEISGTDVDCRSYAYKGRIYHIPPKEMLAKAILSAVFGTRQQCVCETYSLPENLRRFFEGKALKEVRENRMIY